MHYLENNDHGSSFTLPYNGKYVNNDINFDLENFPNSLKQIIFKFLAAHLKKMNEEKNIAKRSNIKI